MKIVFAVPDMVGGGTERVVANLANEFVRRGLEVAILIFAGHTVAYDLDEKIEVVFIGEKSSGNPLVRIKRIFKMRKYYRANKGCYIFAFSVMGAVFSVIAATGIRHRMLVSERNDPTKLGENQKKARDWAYRKAEKIIVQTNDVISLLPKDMQEKAVVIPNPVSDTLPEAYIGPRNRRIVNVARLEPQKNQKLLIEAFALFLNKLEDADMPEVSKSEFSLHIYGQGPLEEELKKEAEELGLSDRIVFHGFCKNVLDEIKDAAMFVLSSDYEGISNSMIEAMSMGIPMISTDCPVGGARMFIENGVNGYLAPINDAEALSDQMICVATSSDDHISELSARATEIRKKYSLKRIADMLLEEAGIAE